ncbi:unnamed protein product [Scytosiphon promiscuus]
MWLPILLVCIAVCSWAVLAAVTYASRWRTRRQYGVAAGATVVGFFHPFCAGGGGGERVLWRAVHTLSQLPAKKLGKPLHVLIYTGDIGKTPADILSGVARQFEISIDPAALPVSFVYLRRRGLLDASLYPVLTMLAQSVASVVLVAEALFRATPDVFVDTTGFAFSFPVAWLAGCSVGAYVHYPTISTDMLSRVRDQRPSHNNRTWITSSVAVSRAKVLYYRAFAFMYGIAGFFAERVMVNSSWTRGHIAALWKRSPPPTVVFPPCDTSELESLPINDECRERCALSVGQFRPEKDHALQVRALAALRKLSGSSDDPHHRRPSDFEDVRLVILGSCRNDGDRQVLETTRALAAELGVEDRVDFVVNCSFEELKAWLGRASVGLHTMWNEHFGIGVVEMMAAGVVTIAHRSGGPAADIVVPLPDGRLTGFLATTPQEYAEVMARVFHPKGVAVTAAAGGETNVSSSSSNEIKVDVGQDRPMSGGKGGGGDEGEGRGGETSVLLPQQQQQQGKGVGGGGSGEAAKRLGMAGEGTVLSTRAIRTAGRESARRFSNDVFDGAFAAEFVELVKHRRSVLRFFPRVQSRAGKED